MDWTNFPLFEIIAFFGIVAGPIFAYIAAKKSMSKDVLLLDIVAVKEWSITRKGLEEEIRILHIELNREQDTRREERKKYLKLMEELQTELDYMKAELRECCELLKNGNKDQSLCP